ncbi:hypothetical protein BJY52DRAFT_278686 [Lactarius psammicola]|nr:hypothetical protein BJY52DRAFT_278686 [Lactarius psammicola]
MDLNDRVPYCMTVLLPWGVVGFGLIAYPEKLPLFFSLIAALLTVIGQSIIAKRVRHQSNDYGSESERAIKKL